MTLLPNDGPNCPSACRRLPLRSRAIWIAITLVSALGAARFSPRSAVAPARIAGFQPLATVPAGAAEHPYFSESWVSPGGHRASAHGSAVCALPGGDLLAIWYGGTREGAADVALFTSRFTAGAGWSAPMLTVDRALAQHELDRSIKKVGNAVVFSAPGGTLWLVYVSVSMGGWSGSALNVKTSQDEGRTWSSSRRLTLNPFLNLSTLVRNKPIYASDGRIGLPVYHEMAMKFPQMLWLTPGPDGSVSEYRIRNLATETGLIQPALVPLGDDRVIMMLRDHGAERRLHTSYSEDNGWTWSDATASGLPNPDSAIDAMRLRDGRILLVYNHANRGRENLRLAVSADSGRSWRTGPIIEAAANKEYSYPFLVEDGAGRIHVTYTWQRERIKHVEFNVAWLDRQLAADVLATHSERR